MNTDTLSKSYECPLCRGNHGSQDCPTLRQKATNTTCSRPGCLNAEHHDLSQGDHPCPDCGGDCEGWLSRIKSKLSLCVVLP